MDIEELLPVGSVIRLKEGKKRLMIYGVMQTDEGNDKQYDYIGVPYPEGNMGLDYQYLFNYEDVEEVYFKGFEDIERQQFIEKLVQYYKENT